MSACSSTFSALCMFLSRPSFGDVSDAAGIAISNASSAPGLTTASQNVGPATALDSATRVTRTVVVDAVYAWMLDVPAMVTRAVSIASGRAACGAAATRAPTHPASARPVKERNERVCEPSLSPLNSSST